MPFPAEGLVYDYKLDDGGISNYHHLEEEEEDFDKPVGTFANQRVSLESLVALYCSVFIANCVHSMYDS